MFCFLSFLRFFGHGEACLFVLLGVPIRILFIMILSFPPSFSIPWVLKISFTYLLTPTADPPGDLPGKSLSDPTQARRPDETGPCPGPSLAPERPSPSQEIGVLTRTLPPRLLGWARTLTPALR